MAPFYIFNISLMLFILFETIAANDQPPKKNKLVDLGEKKISEHVLTVLEHYKQKDPVGLPGAPVPDPLGVPDFAHSIPGLGKVNFKNLKVYGLSKFRISHITTDLASMQVNAALTMDKLNIVGNYSYGTWFSSSSGPCFINLTNVYVQAITRLEVAREGYLEAQEMNVDLSFKDISMNFERLGLFASVFQSVINSGGGGSIFNSIKPFVLSEVNVKMRDDINKQAKQIPQKFPNSITPFDQVIAEARRKVRNMGYDPYRVDNYNNSVGLFEVELSNTWLTGVSSFHRVGNVTFTVKNNTVQADLLVGTQKLQGTSQWDISLAGMISRTGTIVFTVEYLQVQIVVSQSMDTRNTPQLDDIQIELGNIQVRFNGAGTVDYIIELAVNVLPNMLRYQIMDAIEAPLKMRVQEILNTVKVEEVVHENLDKLDDENGLQMLWPQK